MNNLSQPKRYSLLESLVNIGVGLGISVACNAVIFPLFGAHLSLSQNIAVSAFFTAISLIRSYSLRRLFNWIHVKQHG